MQWGMCMNQDSFTNKRTKDYPKLRIWKKNEVENPNT